MSHFVYYIHLCLTLVFHNRHQIHYTMIRHIVSIRVDLYMYKQSIWQQSILECIDGSSCSCQRNEPTDALEGSDPASVEIHLDWSAYHMSSQLHLQAEIEYTQWCTWRKWLIECRDVLGGHIRANLLMQLIVVNNWIWRWAWSCGSSELRDAPGRPVLVSVEMHFQAMSVWYSRLWSSMFGDPHGGSACMHSEMHIWAAIHRNARYTWRWWIRRCWMWRYSISVSNGSGPSLRVRVRLQTGQLPNWRSGLSINPNCLLGYGSMVNSQPVWIGRVVSGSPSGSIYRFI